LEKDALQISSPNGTVDLSSEKLTHSLASINQVMTMMLKEQREENRSLRWKFPIQAMTGSEPKQESHEPAPPTVTQETVTPPRRHSKIKQLIRWWFRGHRH
jgi:hypothetical protein